MRAHLQYSFGTFHLNVRDRLLLENGRVLQLTPKAFDLLVLLVENAGRTLTREQLLTQLWPETHVDPSNLSQHIFWIRKALGESGEDSQFIETAPKVGYRFIAAVQQKKLPEPGDPRSASPAEPRQASGLRIRRPALAAALLALIVVGALLVRDWKPGRTLPRPANSRIAVLPFINLNHDASQDYFSDGFTGEMITLLGRIQPEQLGVIALTTMMHYKASNASVAQIGSDLKVDYVLEGGVQRDGDRVRINARLIQVKDQTEVWARSFNRDMGEVLALESEVARDIAEQIEPRLAGGPETNARPTPPVDRAAYDDYLRGRYFWNQRTVQGYERAIQYFRQAIREDPKDAQAYSGLADAYALLGSTPNPVVARKKAMSQAREAALRALDLDESLAEAHTSLAFVKMHYDWDWTGAEAEFKRAIALNPAYPTAHHWYAYYLIAVGRPQAALAEIKLAQQLDPLSAIINTDVGDVMFYTGQSDDAIPQAQKALEIDPRFPLAHFLLGRVYAEKAQFDKSIAELQQAVELSHNHPWAVCELAAVDAMVGNKTAARELLKQVPARGEDETAYCIATTYASLGDKNRAFAWLDTAFHQRSGSLILLRVDPSVESLRAYPRFHQLEERLAFPNSGPSATLSRFGGPRRTR